MPTLIRWPGVIKPGQVINDICAHEDLIPTFAAAAGESDLVAKVTKGYQASGKTFKVHLDGYNLLPFLKGEVKESPRKEFIYWSDDVGDLMAIRQAKNGKAAFFEQHVEISPDAGGRMAGSVLEAPPPRTCITCAAIRSSAVRRASTTATGWLTGRSSRSRWQGFATKWLESFKEFPPRQKPASFNLDDVMRKMEDMGKAGGNVTVTSSADQAVGRPRDALIRVDPPRTPRKGVANPP